MKKLTLFILPFITLLFAIGTCILLSGRHLSKEELSFQEIASCQLRPSDSPITADGKININTAPSHVLVLLPGIGDVLSQRIIDYREENGPYSQVEELLNVKGIGESTLNKIIDYTAVE